MQDDPHLKHGKLEALAGKIAANLSAQVYIVIKRWIEGSGLPSARLPKQLVDLIMVESFVYCGYTLSRRMESVLTHSELIAFNNILNRVFIIFFATCFNSPYKENNFPKHVLFINEIYYKSYNRSNLVYRRNYNKRINTVFKSILFQLIGNEKDSAEWPAESPRARLKGRSGNPGSSGPRDSIGISSKIIERFINSVSFAVMKIDVSRFRLIMNN
jgi:hypothetical protein